MNGSVIDYENSRTCCLHAELWLTTIETCNRWSALFENHLGIDKKVKEKSCWFSKHRNSKDLLEKNRYGSKIVIQKALGEPDATAV